MYRIPDNLPPGGIALLGVPFDAFSSFLRGSAQAPSVIRCQLRSGASNLSSESGLDLDSDGRWSDAGDLTLPDTLAAMDRIHEGALDLLQRGWRLLSLGGDHSITFPLVRAYAQVYGPLSILHLDAHPDLYDEYEGNRYSHACPMARIMEQGLARELVQVGVRTLNAPQRAQAERYGVRILDMRSWDHHAQLVLHGPVYLSLDLDVLDPAFAPGVSHHEPGGLATRQVLDIIQGFHGELVGADIVEFNPSRDTTGITAALAAKLLKETLARMLAM